MTVGSVDVAVSDNPTDETVTIVDVNNILWHQIRIHALLYK